MEYFDRESNTFTKAEDGVFTSPAYSSFNYSDGRATEAHLSKVFSKANDLSSTSTELEDHIRDWPSEYHLTPKRSQLLRDFDFPKQACALEVGCGCGAITRFLGETFDRVISIEGSRTRAALARKRTRDLANVDIINAPFQVMKFDIQFDYVFCIGVLEYSGSFVDGPEPFNQVIADLRKFLKPDGILVLAIENQYGLKYFSSAGEDHVNLMFEGVEGYPRYGNKIRTFGKRELSEKLCREFEALQFYYPYPDYKLPDAVLSERFLAEARPFELLASMPARDYGAPTRAKCFDERMAYRDLAGNAVLDFFANSFLVFAGNAQLPRLENGADAVVYASNRRAPYRTRTIISKDAAGYRTGKAPTWKGSAPSGEFTLRGTDNVWHAGKTLSRTVWERLLLRSSKFEIAPEVGLWINYLTSQASAGADGSRLVPGTLCDATWENCVVTDDKVELFDQEWVSQNPLKLTTLLVRAAMIFLDRLDNHPAGQRFTRKASTLDLLNKIYEPHGIHITRQDLAAYLDFEMSFQSRVSGMGRMRSVSMWIKTRSFRWHGRTSRTVGVARSAAHLVNRVNNLLRNRLGRKS